MRKQATRPHGLLKTRKDMKESVFNKQLIKEHSPRFYAAAFLLSALFALFTASHFPYTYRSMEADGLWLLTHDFWMQKLATPPSLTLWLTDYLLQWFGTPCLAAVCHATVLFLLTIFAHIWLLRLFPIRKAIGWIALLPGAIIVGYCTLEFHMFLETMFLFALLVAHTFIRHTRLRLLFTLLMLPIGYTLMSMPLLGMMLAGMITAEWKHFKTRNWLYSMITGYAILYLLPIVYSATVAFVPFERRYTCFNSYFQPINSKAVKDLERMRSYITLANEGKWSELLYTHHCKDEAQRGDAIALRFALLAESELGSLPENLPYYPISEEEQFYFPHIREYMTTQFNRLFYEHLGVYDEAFHQSQEFGLLQFNGICFSSLRQMTEYSIREGEWEVADKYLKILEKSSCHAKFIAEKRQEMAQAKKTFKRSIPLRADNFVGGYPLPYEMLRLCRYYKGGPYGKKMLDYTLCSFLLRGDKHSFLQIYKWHGYYTDKNLPETYKTFLQN